MNTNNLHMQIPQSFEAEQGVLGSFLLAPKALDDWAPKIPPTLFYHSQHAAFYGELLALWRAGKSIDQITLTQHLRDKKLWEKLGGNSFLGSLQAAVGSAALLGRYVEILHEKAALRGIIETAHHMLERAYSHDAWQDVLDDVESRVLTVRDGLGTGDGEVVSLREMTNQIIDDWEWRCANQAKWEEDRIKTGFKLVDNCITLVPGRYTVIAARPGIGKTAMATCIALFNARRGKSVGIISCEQSEMLLLKRMMAAYANFSFARAESGKPSQEDLHKINTALRDLRKWPYYVKSHSGPTISQVRATLRRMRSRQKIELGIVDYLQLINGDKGRRYGTREAEVAHVSRELAAASQELGIPIIAMAQLNRTAEGKRPTLADLRESGSIEQDASRVVLLHRDREPAPGDEPGMTLAIIAKNNEGATGDCKLRYDAECLRFNDLAQQEENDQESTRPRKDIHG